MSEYCNEIHETQASIKLNLNIGLLLTHQKKKINKDFRAHLMLEYVCDYLNFKISSFALLKQKSSVTNMLSELVLLVNSPQFGLTGTQNVVFFKQLQSTLSYLHSWKNYKS
jgi:hypothetical protein